MGSRVDDSILRGVDVASEPSVVTPTGLSRRRGEADVPLLMVRTREKKTPRRPSDPSGGSFADRGVSLQLRDRLVCGGEIPSAGRIGDETSPIYCQSIRRVTDGQVGGHGSEVWAVIGSCGPIR